MYNTLSNRVLILDPMLVDLYDAALKNNNIDELENYHPSLYRQLATDKFIIANETDETEEVRKIMQKIDGDESHYHLVINPTMNCNFKCWYCYESHLKSSKMSTQTIDNIVNHIRHVLNTRKKIEKVTISWFGGEPLLYFDKVMLPIMKQVHDIATTHRVAYVQNITTNGFLIKEKMIEYFKRYNFISFQITLDGNRMLHDTVRFVSKNRGSYDDIVANIKILLKNNLPVTMRINYTKRTLEDIEEIYEDLKDLSIDELKYFDISFHQVWQENSQDLHLKVDELVKSFRAKGISANFAFVPDTLRRSCYADKKNHATINYDGNVFKCTARDFSPNNKEGILNANGEIDWNEKYYNRMEIKLKNKPCHSCGILPLCNGGCSQKAIEASGKDYCVFNYDENLKRDVVKRKVENILTQETN